MSEGDIQDGFAAWLKANHIPFICPRRDQKSTIRKGWPDFTVFLGNARVVLIETKVPGGKPRPDQQDCHDELRALGHEVYVCDSAEKCIRRLLDEPMRTEPQRNPHGELVIFGNGVFTAGTMRAVRAATDAVRRTLRRIE